MNLRDLLAGIQQHQNERHQYHWLIAIITHIIILILCLTSKYWRPLLLGFASRYALRRTRAPFRVPVLKTRDARTCALSMTDEECEMEVKAIMGGAEGTSTTGPQTSSMEPAELPTDAKGGTEADRRATLPKLTDVRYSQPGRYQP